MYLEARLKAQTPCTGQLLMLFFTNLNSKNSISIQNGEITLKYFFETEMPKAILEAIEKHEVIELKYEADEGFEEEKEIYTGKESLDELIIRTLQDLSVPVNVVGYSYLKEAIKIVVNDVTSLKAFIKLVYEKVAIQFNVTVSKVEKGIRYAIETIWRRKDFKLKNSKFIASVFKGKSKPTNSEFIAAISEELRLIIEKNGILLDSSQRVIDSSDVEDVAIATQVHKVKKNSAPQNNVTVEKKAKVGQSDKIKARKRKKVKTDAAVCQPTTLKELAGKVCSYEDFVKSILETLNLGKRQVIFATYVEAAEKTEKIKWKTLEAYAENKGVIISSYYDKIFISNKISQYFEADKLTFLEFIKKIVEYKTYDFNLNSEQNDNGVPSQDDGEALEEELKLPETFENETVNPSKEEGGNETIKPFEEAESADAANISVEVETLDVEHLVREQATKKQVKMRCMPEIPEFEEILANIDKNEPVETRVACILNAMGLFLKSSQLQEKLIKFTVAAINLQNINLQSIFMETSISSDYLMEARIELSKLINDFVSRFASGTKVKLVDFLRDLQSKLILEKEEVNDINY